MAHMRDIIFLFLSGTMLFPVVTAYIVPNTFNRQSNLQNDAFLPNKFFSDYFGNSHISGGRLAENQYVCSMAYVTMRSGGTLYTGSGVLISNWYVLTAAHNFDSHTTLSNVRVYIGDRDGGSSAAVPIENVWRLSGYTDGSPRGGDDIAIIKLAADQRQPDNCLIHWQSQEFVDPSDGDVVTALGYGRSTSSRTDARGLGTLRQASLRIAENGNTVAGLPVCADQSEASQVICAVSPGYPALNSAGTCLSDSGGPLIKDTGTLKWVVGLNSYSDTNCDAAGNVDMFARVYPHRNAIHGMVYRDDTAGWVAIPR